MLGRRLQLKLDTEAQARTIEALGGAEMKRLLSAWIAIASLASVACGPTDEVKEPISDGSWKLAQPGPWDIPDETLAIGDTQYVPYVGGGPWVGEQGCSGDITPGAKLVREYLYAHFPQTYSIGGYSCRTINGDPNNMSVHGTGRALDVMIHTIAEEADNDLGDPIGNWLIENAEAIGIQYIIWDVWTWQAARPVGAKEKAYGGAHPHNDHLHVELSVEASKNTQDWFSDKVQPPAILGCDPIPPEGIVMEETDACFHAFGPAKYWREELGKGHADRLLWTNAFENDSPSNWARWNLDLQQAGKYTVEVWVDPEFGVYDQARYAVTAAGQETLVTVDQSQANGWTLLGEFDLAAGAEQHVSLYDNVLGTVAADQKITADALRLTPEGGQPPPSGWDPDPLDPQKPGPSASGSGSAGDAEGGCACRATGHRDTNFGALRWLALGLGAAYARRRRALKPRNR